MAARLKNGLRLLAGARTGSLPRQKTLRATLARSYQLLDEAHRTLLRRLSVVAGGWSRDGVDAGCGGLGREAAPERLLGGSTARKRRPGVAGQSAGAGRGREPESASRGAARGRGAGHPPGGLSGGAAGVRAGPTRGRSTWRHRARPGVVDRT